MWETVKLGEIATWVRGLTYSKKDEVDTDGIAVLRATNIDLATHKIVLGEIRYVSETVKVKDDKYTKLGDLLVCTASGSKSHVGKVAIVEEDLGMAFGGFMAALRCNEHCLPRFLYHVLTSQNFKWHLKSLGDGANINNLKFSQIEEYEIPLPPLAEQQRIVAKLDAAFAEIDRAIEVAESKHTEVVKLKAALLSSLLRGEDWETVKLGDVVSFDKKNGKDSGLPYVGMENISSMSMQLVGEIAVPESTSSTFVFDDSHVLYGRLRPYLKKVLVPNFKGQCSTEIFCLKPNGDLLREYLSYWLLNPKTAAAIENTSTGARMPRANMSIILNFEIPLPPLAEQQRIVAKLDAAFAELDRAQASVSEAKAHYQALKSAILAQELTPPQSAAA